MIRHALAPHVPAAARALGIQRTLPAASGVALTFDDGPHPVGTPAVLDALDRAGAHGMFFMVGEQVTRRPALVAEVHARGHAIALHGYTHHWQMRLRPATVEDDMRRGRAAIEDATGITPRWHRPPYGLYSRAGLESARAAGMRPLLWSRWGKDWRKFTTPARIAARATADLGPGDVILLHDADFYSARDSHVRTTEALERILALLEMLEMCTVLPV
jgi:peptidoglycan/xylan/chitin deacetylase (PgdA/CDA1 family)